MDILSKEALKTLINNIAHLLLRFAEAEHVFLKVPYKILLVNSTNYA